MSPPPVASRLAGIDRDWVQRRGLREFVTRAWPQVEPAEMIPGRHIDAVCEHLEAWLRGDFDALVINEPPGCSKSLIVSTLFAAYVWIERPTWRWITASYDREVAMKDARRHRELVAGDWWAARWPGVGIPRGADASTAVGFFQNTSGGSRYSTTTGGSVTGQHGDGHIIDDPHDVKGVASSAELEATLTWWRETMPTRFRDPKRPRRILVMQRLHERDLTAEMVKEGATVLCLPMRYERAHPYRYRQDWRTEEGELLVPDRYPAEALERLETRLGPRQTAAQLQQRPAPAAGAIFREEWLQRHWIELPPGGQYAISVDAAFKGTDTSDYVVIQVWYTLGPNHFLVDQVRGRMDFVQTVAALTGVCQKYPKALLKLIEDKANGPAIVATLKPKFSGLVEVTPDGGKVARAHSVEPLFAGGNVWFPDPAAARYDDGRRGAPWVPGVKLELLAFPVGANDDQVDALTQYLRHVALGSYASRLKAAVDKANPPRS